MLINGNRITKDDILKLEAMNKLAIEYASLYSSLTSGCQSHCYDTHSSDTWLGHVARWSMQNTQEVLDSINDGE